METWRETCVFGEDILMWFDIIKLDREYLRSLREKGYDVPEEMTKDPITNETLLQEIVDWFKEKGADVEVSDVKHNGKRDATASSAIGLAKHTEENPLFTRVIRQQMPLEPRSKKVNYYKRIVGDKNYEIGFYLFLYYPTEVNPKHNIFLGDNWQHAIEDSLENVQVFFAPQWRMAEMRAGDFYNTIINSIGGKVDPDGLSHITGDSGNKYTFNFLQDCNVSFYKEISDELKKDIKEAGFSGAKIPYRIGPITMCIHERSGLPLGDTLAAMVLALKNDTAENTVEVIKAAAQPLSLPDTLIRQERFIARISTKHSRHITDLSATHYLNGSGLFAWNN
jgi:hypothetical protein